MRVSAEQPAVTRHPLLAGHNATNTPPSEACPSPTSPPNPSTGAEHAHTSSAPSPTAANRPARAVNTSPTPPLASGSVHQPLPGPAPDAGAPSRPRTPGAADGP